MNSKKYLIFILAVFFFSIIIFIPKKNSFVRLIFFDVGQGDSSLIILPSGEKILVDGGPDDQVLLGLGRYLNFFDRKIDLVILSHEHDDHVFGLVQVLGRYQVGKIIQAASSCQNLACREFFKIAKDDKVELENLDVAKKIIFGPNCFLKLFPPENPESQNINNRSIALKLDCNGAKILLAGDGEVQRENELLTSSEDLSAAVFKASHHGSNTSNGEIFLKAINPGLVVIPVGAENSFKHPSESTLERFNFLGIKYFRADLNGNISLNFLGTSYPQITIDKQ